MRTVLLTIFTLFVCFAFAQNFYPPIINYSVKDYGKNDRNPENYAVVQDLRGIMYFGNANGVLEYDGIKWNFIQVGYNSFVYSLGVDRQGVVYVGTFGDFGYLKPDKKGQLVFVSLAEKLPEEDQFFSTVWRIHNAGNSVYFQAEEQVFKYDIISKKMEVIYPETSFHTSFLIDSTLYLRQREIGIVKYENDELKKLKGTDDFKVYGAFGLHQLADDSLLIITQELGLMKWYNDSLRVLPAQNKTRLSDLGIIGSLQLSDGNFALNTLTNGVVIIDSNGKILKRIDRLVGVRSDIVHGAYQDRDLNLWLALGNGISKVNYHSPLSYFDEKAGLEGNVDAITRFKGKIFVGTTFGLFTQDSTLYGSRKFKNTGLIQEQVWDFCEVNEILYIATAEGIYATTDGIRFKQLNRINTNVLLYRIEKNQFVGAGAKGVYVYDQNFNFIYTNITNYSTFLGGEIDPENPNSIWLGTAKSGMVQLNDVGNGFSIDLYGDADGLLDGLGKPLIFEDKLLFGAKDGLFYFEDAAALKKNLIGFDVAETDQIRGMFNRYTLYDSTFVGQLFLLAKGEDVTWYCNEYKIGLYQHDSKEFLNRPFWGIDYGRINTFYLEPNGVLWIGASDGVIRYEKNELKKYESVFYALIRNVEVIGKDSVLFSGGDQFFGKDGFNGGAIDHQPILEYSNNDISFQYSAPYFEDEHQPTYRYFLEGYDREWSAWDLKSEKDFNNLHEGTYTFRVQAQNIYGQLSKEASYTFIINPPWYRTVWAYICYAFLFVFVLFLGVWISSKRLKAKNIWLEGVVEERTKEISDKNIVLEDQKQEIEDSINYAQRIQHAILPLDEEMKKWIPNSFVLFRPKDIVSGDFYWFMERDNKLIIICADCTGHGVPGAFMSMIGSDRLNNIVSENKITEPGMILSALNKAIKKSLKQDGEKNTTRDGMDAAVCTIDMRSKKISFAGANRALWIVHNNQVEEIKATKVAVAGFTPDDQVYKEHTFLIENGMKFYMTTDGYADQFGGESDKKYKVRKLKEFILQNANMPFDMQKETLEKELVDWMNGAEQIDDVCIVGFML